MLMLSRLLPEAWVATAPVAPGIEEGRGPERVCGDCLRRVRPCSRPSFTQANNLQYLSLVVDIMDLVPCRSPTGGGTCGGWWPGWARGWACPRQAPSCHWSLAAKPPRWRPRLRCWRAASMCPPSARPPSLRGRPGDASIACLAVLDAVAVLAGMQISCACSMPAHCCCNHIKVRSLAVVLWQVICFRSRCCVVGAQL